jgi:hypothetical protein
LEIGISAGARGGVGAAPETVSDGFHDLTTPEKERPHFFSELEPRSHHVIRVLIPIIDSSHAFRLK